MSAIRYCRPEAHLFRRERPSRRIKPPHIFMSVCRKCPAILWQGVNAVEQPGGDVLPRLTSYLLLSGCSEKLESSVYRRVELPARA